MAAGPFEIVTRDAYRAVGLRWSGPWSGIPELKETIRAMAGRVGELTHAVEPDVQLGLSYHDRPDGFTHFSVYEVTGEQVVPDGMTDIRVPALTYVAATHERGADVGATYESIAAWIESAGYTVHREPGVTYSEDAVPIKHERYPRERDPADRHFDILVPVVPRAAT